MCDSMRIVREEANATVGLDDVSLIRCTVLRKYIATVTQVSKAYVRVIQQLNTVLYAFIIIIGVFIV